MHPSIEELSVWQFMANMERYRALDLDSNDPLDRQRFSFDGRWVDQWDPPPLFEDQPHLESPDIWGIVGTSALVFTPRAMDRLESDCMLSAAGQLLPVTVNGSECAVLNILEIRAYLSVEDTIWFAKESHFPRVPVFVPNRFSGSSVFKIAPKSLMFCWGSATTPSNGFYGATEQSELKGLKFDHVWSSESGGKELAILS